MQCKNCSTIITQVAHFCPNCGERTHPKRLQVKEIVGSFLAGFYDIENKLIKTFRHMLTQPEVVIDNYVQGFRKNYVNVITYLSISLTLLAIQIFIFKNFFPELMKGAEQPPVFGVDVNKINALLFEYQGILLIIFTPVTALATWAPFHNFRYNFAEHIVLNIYPTAQFFIIWFFVSLIIIGLKIDYQWASLLTIPVLFLYMLYIFQRLFQLTWLDAFLRTVIYGILYLILSMGIFVMAYAAYFFYLFRTGQINLNAAG